MSNIEAYEQNLLQRLGELKLGDPAYILQERAITEAIIFACDQQGQHVDKQRILDVGCGLGFLTAKLSTALDADVVGIDPSEQAITLAKSEHMGVTFYRESAETFSDKLVELEEEPFDSAVLNMVLHATDDKTASSILTGVRQSLRFEGTIVLVVPGSKWLMQKLIEYALDQGMDKGLGMLWVQDKLSQKEVELPVKIRGGKYYPHPIMVYNRALEEYGNLLRANNFGVVLETYDSEEHLLDTQTLPYWEPVDYLSNYELVHRQRDVLISFNLPDK